MTTAPGISKDCDKKYTERWEGGLQRVKKRATEERKIKGETKVILVYKRGQLLMSEGSCQSNILWRPTRISKRRVTVAAVAVAVCRCTSSVLWLCWLLLLETWSPDQRNG